MIPSNILGIDIGSVSISVAEISLQKELVREAYGFHHGAITETLKNILSDVHLSEICAVAATTSTPSVLKVSHLSGRRPVKRYKKQRQ